jgi:hypothetical protein
MRITLKRGWRWVIAVGTFLVVVCFCFALLRSEAKSQTQTAGLTKSFEGCYELTLGRWWPFDEDLRFIAPPSRVRLLTELGTKGFEKDRFLIRAIPTEKGAALGHRRASNWNVKSANEIDLIWNNGFTGVTLSLKKSGDELNGWAHPHFDFPSLIPNTAHALARKIACEAQP